MKKSEIIFISLILVIFCILTINIVSEVLIGSKLFEYNLLLDKFLKTKIVSIAPPRTDVCSSQNKLNISETSEPHLVQIKKYQEICRSKATNTIMIFVDMPKDGKIAKESAIKISKTLKQLDEVGITPIVIVEPVTDWGLVDFNEFSTGFYDAWIIIFFETLKTENITGKQMGMWVPFPEANLPLWNHSNTTPDVYSKVVNKYLKILKTNFPDTKTGILLNSATYELDDFSWTSGDYVSLIPYVKNLDKQLVDSFGLQGLPWAPSSSNGESGSVLNASEFLSSKLAMEAANELGVKEIWLNTGTFGAKYTQDLESTTLITPSVRLDILNAILSEAEKIKKNGFEVTINLFSQDKSKTTEATDWSYLDESFVGSLETESIFVKFVSMANYKNINISLFDRLDK